MTEAPPVTVMVEAAFGSDRMTDLSAAVWTDLSDRATGRTATWAVGRHGQGGQSDPSSLNIELNNDDGWLTSQITRELPLRLSVALEGDTPVEQITAFLKRARFDWDTTGEYCTVIIEATGRLDGLQQTGSSSSTAAAGTALRGTILATSPDAYWPIEDGTAASSAASAVAGVPAMTKSGTLAFGTGNGGPGSDPILDLAEVPTALGRLSATLPVISGTVTALRIGFVSTWPAGGFVGEVGGIVHLSTTGDFGAWKVNLSGVSPANEMEIEYSFSDDGSTAWVTQTNTSPYDGIPKWHMLELVEDGSDVDVTLYRNGSVVIAGTVSSQSLSRPTDVKINAGSNHAGPAFGAQMPAVGHVAVWVNTDPDTDSILAAFGIDATTGETTGGGFDGESAGDRIQRLCDAASIPVIVLSGPTSAMGPQGANSLIDLLRECEAADGGLLHDGGPDAALVYQPRSARYNAPVALEVDVQDRHELSAGLGAILDDRGYLPALTVSQPSGSSGTYSTIEGIDPPGVTLNLADSEDLEQHAAFRVLSSITDDLAYDSVPLNLGEQPELLAAWQSSDRVGIRIAMTSMPDQHPIGDVDQFADGFHAMCDGLVLVVDLDTVPAAPYEVITLDTTACTLTTSVDADDTSWSVQFSAPPLWDTDVATIQMRAETEREIIATSIATTAITFVNVGAASHANNASVTPALPASVATRDLLCIVVAIRSSGTGTINVPTGYTRMVGWHNFAILGKIHTGSESNPTVTFTGGSAGDDTSAFMFALRGTIQDPAAAVIDWNDWLNPSDQDILYPPLTAPLYNGCAVIIAGWKQDDWTSVDQLAGMTEMAEPDTTTGNDQGIVADYVIQTTATAIASGFFNVTGGATAISRGIVLAIAPGLQTLTVTRGTPAASHAAGVSIQVDRPGNVAL